MYVSEQILVFVEHQDGQIAQVSLQLIGKALDLAQKRQMQTGAVLLASQIDTLVEQLQGLGLDKIIVSEHEAFDRYSTDSFIRIVCQVVEQEKPSIFLFGATSSGRDLAPRVAARLGTGLSADCVDLDIDENGILLQHKPTYGGSVMAEIVCKDRRPQMTTVRPGVFPITKLTLERKTEIIEVEFEAAGSDQASKILEQNLEDYKCDDCITDAAIVVCGGRGIGSHEDFSLVEQLAEALGGVSACTRPLADAGLLPREKQIGLSGQTVRPDLLVAVGISGAANFTVGIEQAKKIIAINKDAQAPIFKIANVGIVGDAKAVLTQLIKKLTPQ